MKKNKCLYRHREKLTAAGIVLYLEINAYSRVSFAPLGVVYSIAGLR